MNSVNSAETRKENFKEMTVVSPFWTLWQLWEEC